MTFNDDCKFSILISVCKKAVSYLNRDESWRMTRLWNENNSLFIELANKCKEAGLTVGDDYVRVLNNVKTSVNDRNKCSFVINNELLPILYSILDNSDISLDINDDYRATGSRSGYTVLYDKLTGKSLNSLEDPMWEAMEKADSIIKPETRRIYILGVELGFLAYACWLATFKAARIVILDSEENIRIACDYGVLGCIDEKNVTILCSDDYDELFDEFVKQDELTDLTAYHISENVPVRAKEYRENMESFLSNQVLARDYTPKYAVNYWKNIENCQGGMEEFKKYAEQTGKASLFKEIVVVAAGPSLAENLDFLRDSSGKRLMIAVSTAARKLAAENIKPDVLTVYDPLSSVMPHLDGVMEFLEGTPLITEAVAYWGFAESFPGPCFRALADDTPMVKSEAIEKDLQIWSGGSTVSVFTAELAARLGAEKVYLIGADYAYPGNKKYADSTSEDAKFEIYVRSVDGSMVGTTETFKLFLKDTESLVKRHKGKVTFINMSAHGAFIKGTYCGKWWEEFPKEAPQIRDYISKIKDEASLSWSRKYYLFRQALTKATVLGVTFDENFVSAITETFSVIKKEFLDELSWNPSQIQKKTGLILLLTSFFSEEKDELTTGICEDAVKIRNKGKSAVIFNTGEYLGGEEVALSDPVESFYPDSLADRESISYKGNRYPYFQAPKGMPDPDVIRSFLEMFSASVPELVINYDPFSLTAAAFELLTDVEHR